MGDHQPETDDGDEGDEPGWRQKLHWLTDDRDGEAKALSDRAGDEVDEEAARIAVARAHGERRDGDPEPGLSEDLATVEDAEAVAEERD